MKCIFPNLTSEPRKGHLNYCLKIDFLAHSNETHLIILFNNFQLIVVSFSENDFVRSVNSICLNSFTKKRFIFVRVSFQSLKWSNKIEWILNSRNLSRSPKRLHKPKLFSNICNQLNFSSINSTRYLMSTISILL